MDLEIKRICISRRCVASRGIIAARSCYSSWKCLVSAETTAAGNLPYTHTHTYTLAHPHPHTPTVDAKRTREGSGFSNQSMHVYAPANDYIIQQQCASPAPWPRALAPPCRTLHFQNDSRSCPRKFHGRSSAGARRIHLAIDLAGRTFKCGFYSLLDEEASLPNSLVNMFTDLSVVAWERNIGRMEKRVVVAELNRSAADGCGGRCTEKKVFGVCDCTIITE